MKMFALTPVALLIAGLSAHADGAAPTQVASLPPAAATRVLVHKAPLAWPTMTSPYREATVTLRYRIEPDGSVDHIEPAPGAQPNFAAAAIAALSQWSYAPAATASTGEAVALFHAPR